MFVERLWQSIKYEEVYLHAYESVSAAKAGIGRYLAFYMPGDRTARFAMIKKMFRREKMVSFFTRLSSCMVAMEACGSAHYWARRLTDLGHMTKLIAPQLVKPYVKSNKHDAADAEAICEAASWPGMRFVAAKSPESQSVLALHRVRDGFIKARTAQANQLRGLLVSRPINNWH